MTGMSNVGIPEEQAERLRAAVQALTDRVSQMADRLPEDADLAIRFVADPEAE